MAKRLFLLLPVCLVCAAALAETVVTKAGVVVQGRVLQSNDKTMTIEVPLYGGVIIPRDAIRMIYEKGVEVEATEDQTEMRAIADANQKKLAEKEAREKNVTVQELPEAKLNAMSARAAESPEGGTKAPKTSKTAPPGKTGETAPTHKGTEKPTPTKAPKTGKAGTETVPAKDATPTAKPRAADETPAVKKAAVPTVAPETPVVPKAATPAVVTPKPAEEAPVAPKAVTPAPVTPKPVEAPAPVPVPAPAPAPAPKPAEEQPKAGARAVVPAPAVQTAAATGPYDEAIVKVATEKAKQFGLNLACAYVTQPGGAISLLPGAKATLQNGELALHDGDMLVNVGGAAFTCDGGNVALNKGEYVVVRNGKPMKAMYVLKPAKAIAPAPKLAEEPKKPVG